MPQEDDNQEETPLIKQLRSKIEELSGQVSNLTTDNRALNGQNTLANAGFSYLNETQRAAVLAMHKEQDMTSETVAAVAAQLGYTPLTTPPPVQAPQQAPQVPQQNDPATQNQQVPVQPYPQVAPQVPQVPYPQVAQPWNQAPPVQPQTQVPPNYNPAYPATATNPVAQVPFQVNPALAGMQQIQNAQTYGQVPPQPSFTDQLKAATSQKDVENIIRSQGAQFGIVHEMDID